MAIAPGDYEIGPPASRLRLFTFRQGLAARAGHDLVIEARAWHGTVQVPRDFTSAGGASSAGVPPASVRVEIDLRELEVLEGSGGVKPLTDSDRRDIKKTMQGVLRTGAHPLATFSSTDVHLQGDGAVVEGELSLGGETHPVRVQVRDDGGGTVSGRAEVVQSRWGIKPYTGFFGALKLRDAVDLEFTLALRPA